MTWRTPEWDDAWRVSIPPEVDDVFKKAASRNVAPGPDCIKSQIWRKVPRSIIRWVVRCFALCFREGVFLESWKRANLVLIPKGIVTDDSPIRARPICLLDELGKAFERVIATRLQDWMDENPESGLSDFQFGFRKHRSTVCSS